MTQLEYARKNKATPQMRTVAKAEGLDVETIRKKVASGRVVIPSSLNRRIEKPCGIGEGLKTKVNANIGTSVDSSNLAWEIKKLRVAISSGADTVMDLSTGGDLKKTRRKILEVSSVPVGTVPIYEAAVNAAKRKKSIVNMTEDDIFSVIESQAQQGVDFMTIHCGLTREAIDRLRRQGRIMDVVSRGGAFLMVWIIVNRRENPLYEKFDKILEIAKTYDVTLSLGDGMRPGSLSDATDRAQIQELILLGELAKRAQDFGVQVIIEGPGHIPINQIQMNVSLQKSLCDGAPFYVLGPLVTDVAPGYDHIVGAIGGALAASFGADFLCYVTASEHLRLPTVEDVKEGVIASRIAAHAADIAKGIKGSLDWDISISKARRKRDWKRLINTAIDKERPRKFRSISKPSSIDVCTMCGKYCAIKIVERYLKD